MNNPAILNPPKPRLRPARGDVLPPASSRATFPPRDGFDIAGYDNDECVAGYRSWYRDDLEPGDNHSPAYRWGWFNARRDHQAGDDGFDAVRHVFIKMRRRPN